MFKQFKLAIGAALTSTLVACGGGGGTTTSVGSGSNQNQAPTSIPLRIAAKNLYTTASQRSGTITGTKTGVVFGQPGLTTSQIGGQFTSTTTQNGQATVASSPAYVATISRAEVIDGYPILVNFQVAIKTDYSAIVDSNNCSLPIPDSAQVGFTAIMSCPGGTSNGVSLVVTEGTNSTNATVGITNAFGAELYSVSSSGVVTPISISRQGRLVPATSLIDYNIKLVF
jgi:hypothetical protein